MKSKYIIRMLLLSFVCGAMLSCKDPKPALPSLSGSTHEILVVMDKSQWNGPIGDSVKYWFRQEQIGLPQPEPVFDVLNLPTAFFEKNVKAYRNILFVNISPEVDSASLIFKESPWAKTQKYFQINAPDNKAFLRVFDANKQKITDVFLKAEKDRLMDVYKRKPEAKVAALFKDKYNISLSVPSGYVINKDLKDFVWISYETQVDSRGIIFFQRRYSNLNMFQYQHILDTVNAVLEANIPGPLPKTYMALDTVAPIVSRTYNYDEVHYAVLMKGLWTVVNDFMGGPFVLNVILDEKYNRVIYMLGYVYAPDGKKRNMIRQVEAAMFTTGFIGE